MLGVKYGTMIVQVYEVEQEETWPRVDNEKAVSMLGYEQWKVVGR